MALNLGTITVMLSAETSKFRAGIQAASEEIEKTKKRFEDATAVAKPLAVAGSAAFAAIALEARKAVTSLVQYGEQVDKLVKSTGAAAETIERLGYAAQQEHASMEALSTGLLYLSRQMAEAASGSKTAQEAFARIGVSVTDAAGNLRRADEVLLDVADRFASTQSEVLKAQTAFDLFSRSGRELIPFLSMGRDEIERLGKEAEQVGVVLSGEAVRAAEALGDSFTRLSESARGLHMAIGTALMPTVSGIVDAITRAINAVTGWIREHPKLVETLTIVAASFSGAAAAVGGLTLAIPALIAAFASIMSPLGLLSLALGALVSAGILVYKNWDTIKYYAQQAWAAIKVGVLSAVDAILAGLEKFIGWIPGLGAKLKAARESVKALISDEVVAATERNAKREADIVAEQTKRALMARWGAYQAMVGGGGGGGGGGTGTTDEAAKVIEALNKELVQAASLSKLFGGEFDALEAKTDAYRKAIEDLVALGLSPQSKTVQELITKYRELRALMSEREAWQVALEASQKQLKAFQEGLVSAANIAQFHMFDEALIKAQVQIVVEAWREAAEQGRWQMQGVLAGMLVPQSWTEIQARDRATAEEAIRIGKEAVADIERQLSEAIASARWQLTGAVAGMLVPQNWTEVQARDRATAEQAIAIGKEIVAQMEQELVERIRSAQWQIASVLAGTLAPTNWTEIQARDRATAEEAVRIGQEAVAEIEARLIETINAARWKISNVLAGVLVPENWAEVQARDRATADQAIAIGKEIIAEIEQQLTERINTARWQLTNVLAGVLVPTSWTEIQARDRATAEQAIAIGRAAVEEIEKRLAEAIASARWQIAGVLAGALVPVSWAEVQARDRMTAAEAIEIGKAAVAEIERQLTERINTARWQLTSVMANMLVPQSWTEIQARDRATAEQAIAIGKEVVAELERQLSERIATAQWQLSSVLAGVLVPTSWTEIQARDRATAEQAVAIGRAAVEEMEAQLAQTIASAQWKLGQVLAGVLVPENWAEIQARDRATAEEAIAIGKEAVAQIEAALTEAINTANWKLSSVLAGVLVPENWAEVQARDRATAEQAIAIGKEAVAEIERQLAERIATAQWRMSQLMAGMLVPENWLEVQIRDRATAAEAVEIGRRVAESVTAGVDVSGILGRLNQELQLRVPLEVEFGLAANSLTQQKQALERAIGEIIDAMAEAGKSTDQIRAAVAPLLGDLGALTQRIHQLQVQTQLFNSFLGGLAEGLAEAGTAWADFLSVVVSSIKLATDEAGNIIGVDWKETLINIANYGLRTLGQALGTLFGGTAQLARQYPGGAYGVVNYPDLARMRENYESWQANFDALRRAQQAQAGMTVGGGLLGGIGGFLIGGLFGMPWLGALIGAGIGAGVGHAAGQATYGQQIEDLKEKLQDTFQKIAETLGTAISNVADALGSAFSAETYEDFLTGFATNLEGVVKQALIKAFMAGEAMRPLLQGLSDFITAAVMDGVLSADEKLQLAAKFQEILAAAKPFWEALQEFDFVEAVGGATEALNEFSEALRNVPTGFKITSARWEAALPAYQEGGVVGRTGVALLHAGETVLPAGAGAGIHIHLEGSTIYGADDFERVVVQAVSKAAQRAGLGRYGLAAGVS